MIVSINQPAYLPWLGYFDRIEVSDLHVVLDHVQFEKNSFVNRNRILGPAGPMWLTVPVRTKGQFGAVPISEIAVASDQRWQRKHLLSLRQAYSRAPFFERCEPVFAGWYDREWPTLIELLSTTTDFLRSELDICTPTVSSSTLGLTKRKSELVLEICRKVGASVYLSGPLGRGYLQEEEFRSRGIHIRYHDFEMPRYRQGGHDFVSGLSIVDLLVHAGPDGARALLGHGGRTD